MITSALLSFIGFFLGFIVSLLPSGSGIPASIELSFYNLAEGALAWDYYFPVITFFSVLLIIASAHLALFGWKTLKYIVALVRGN